MNRISQKQEDWIDKMLVLGYPIAQAAAAKSSVV